MIPNRTFCPNPMDLTRVGENSFYIFKCYRYMFKILDMFNLFGRRSEDCLVVNPSRSDRPNKSISIGLSLTGR